MSSERKISTNLVSEVARVAGRLRSPSFSPRMKLMAITGALAVGLTLTGCTEISDLTAGRNPHTKIEPTECQGKLTLATIRDRVKKAQYKGVFDGESEVVAFNNISCDPDNVYDAIALDHRVVLCQGANITWAEVVKQLRVAGYDGERHKWRGRPTIAAYKRTAAECLNS